MGKHKTSFAYDDRTAEELEVELRAALVRLDLLTNGDALRLRHNVEVASLNQLSKKKRAALRLATMEAITGMREEMRRRGVILAADRQQ